MASRLKLPPINNYYNTLDTELSTKNKSNIFKTSLLPKTNSIISGKSVFFNYKHKFQLDKESFQAQSSDNTNKVNTIVSEVLKKSRVNLKKKKSEIEKRRSSMFTSEMADKTNNISFKNVAKNKVEFQINSKLSIFKLLSDNDYMNCINKHNISQLIKFNNVKIK